MDIAGVLALKDQIMHIIIDKGNADPSDASYSAECILHILATEFNVSEIKDNG